MKIPFASDYIPKKLRTIPRQVKAAMLSALIVGLACHIQPLTEQLINHDTVVSISDDGMWLLSQGKWFFGYVASLRGTILTSAIETTLALLLLSVVAGLTTTILRVKGTLYAVFVGAFIVAFPSVFCNILYPQEEVFFTAFLLATLAVYFTTKYKLGFIGGAILLTFSLGTYQTYIGFAAGLFIIAIILDIFEKEKKPREILLDGIKYIAVMLVAVGLYYVCLQIILAIRGVELSDYMGVSSMGSNLTIHGILSQSLKAYKEVFNFMLFDSVGTKQAVFVWGYRLVLVANVTLFVLIAIKRKLYKNVFMLLLALVLGAFALPLAVHAVSVLGSTAYTHWLMKYPFVLIFIVMLVLLEHYISLYCDDNLESPKKKSLKNNIFSGIQWLGMALAVMLVFNWFILANQCYQKMRYVKDAVYAKTNELVSAIYNDDDYKKDIEIAIIGNTPYEFLKDPKTELNMYQTFTGCVDAENVFYSKGVMLAYLRNFLGVTFNTVDEMEFEAQHQEEVDSMSVYPGGRDSIQVIDGVLVIKLSETADEAEGTE